MSARRTPTSDLTATPRMYPGNRPPPSGDALDHSGLTECTTAVRRQDSSSDFCTPDRRSAATPPPVRECEVCSGAKCVCSPVDLSPALLERHNRHQPLQGLSSLSLGDREALNLDNFAIVCKIGEGSFGKVVLARKKDDGALHAVKAVRKEKLLASGSAAIQHVLDENSILQRLRHPFVLTLQYAFQDADRLYLVTNYVGGGTLYQLITQRGKVKEDLVRFYAAQLAAAFAYLHLNHVVYRDLKPENVLLGLDGYVVLADFGLAKTLVDTTTSTFCGTPLYLAPEVVSRRPYSFSVDWWTLGCLTVEMLTGRPPFVARDLPELMQHIEQGNRSFDVSTLSGNASMFVLGLLQKDVSKRLKAPGVFDTHFLRSMDRTALENKTIEPPYIPDPASEAIGRGGSPRHASQRELAQFANFNAFCRDESPRAHAELSSKLCDAARRGACGELRELMADGADVNGGDYDRRTALHLGAAEGHLEVVDFLIAHGADVNAQDRWRGTPLRDARDHPEVVELLKRHGARDSVAEQRASVTEADVTSRLCDAARRGDVDSLRRLVAAGAEVTRSDYDDRTPLHLGAAEGHVRVVEYLIARGADVNACDRWRGTPLRDAEDGGHQAVVQLLKRHGAKRLKRRSRSLGSFGNLREAFRQQTLRRNVSAMNVAAVAPEPVGLDLSQSGSDGRLSPSSLMDRSNRSAGSARSGRSSPSSLTRLFHRRKAPSMDASGSTRAVERSTLDSSGRGLVIDPPARGRREGDQLDRSNELDRSNASCKLM